jgi:hypothetical protein
MIRVFFFIGLLFLSMECSPQFLGGNADGYGACKSSVVTLNNQTFYCGGGNADGYNAGASAALPINNQEFYCSGGNADGYTANSWNGTSVLFTLFCSGGDGDGYVANGSSLGTFNNQVFYCSGGIRDGYARSATGMMTLNNQVFYCSGGNADGYDMDLTGVFVLNNQLFYCSGGIADGYVSDDWNGSFLDYLVFCSGGGGDGYNGNSGLAYLGGQGNYCSGGNGDGYHHLGSSVVTFGNGIWRGVTSISWNTASNWQNGTVPDETIDVVIPPGCSYYPVLAAGDLSVNNGSGTYRCKGILIQGTARLTNLGPLSVYGNFNVYGEYTATNNQDTSQIIGYGGKLTLGTGGLISIGNQSSSSGLCDLLVKNGGELAVDGGSLYIDDQLNIRSGGTMDMSDGIIFAHYYGQGSDYSSSSPGSFYISPGASGTVAGGMVKVNGKTSNGSFSAVAIYSPSFDFSGTGKLKLTDGNHASYDVAEIRTIAGADLNRMTVDKPFRTVKIGTNANILGDVIIMPESKLEIGTGKTVMIGGDLILRH